MNFDVLLLDFLAAEKAAIKNSSTSSGSVSVPTP